MRFLVSEVPLYANICIEGYSDPKGAGLFCGTFIRKGEVSAYRGRNKNIKDLKA